MKKLLPVVQRHGEFLTKTIDERITTEKSAVIEGKSYLALKCVVADHK
jgi:hypothetical protein